MQQKQAENAKLSSQMKENHQQIQGNIESLKDSLRKLLVAKKNGEKITKNEKLTNEHNKVYQTLMNVRRQQRQLYINLEKDQNNINAEKEIIDEKYIYYQSLEYQKQIIINNTKIASNLPLKDIEKLPQFEQIKEREEQIVQDKEQIKSMLNDELQHREKKAQLLKEKEQYKKKMIEEHDKSIKQFTEDLPKKFVDICKEIKPVQQIFKIPYQDNPYQKSLEQHLSPLLSRLYSQLKDYFKKDELDEEIEIFTTLPFFMTQSGKKYELSGHVIQITFEQCPKEKLSDLEKKCNELKINLNYSSIFPFKFQFREQTKLKKIMLSTEKSGSLKVDDFFITNLFGITNNLVIVDSRGSETSFYQVEMLNNIVHSDFQNQDPDLERRGSRHYRANEDSDSDQENDQENDQEVQQEEDIDENSSASEDEQQNNNNSQEKEAQIEEEENNQNGNQDSLEEIREKIDQGKNLVEQIRKRAVQIVVLKGILDRLQKYEVTAIAKVLPFKKIGLKEFNQLQDKKAIVDEEEGEYKETLDETNVQSNQMLDKQIYKFQIDNLQVLGLKQTVILQLYNEYPSKQCEIQILDGTQDCMEITNREFQHLKQNNKGKKQNFSIFERDGKNFKSWLSSKQREILEKILNDKKYLGDELGLFYQFRELIKYLGDTSLFNEMEQDEKQDQKDNNNMEQEV